MSRKPKDDTPGRLPLSGADIERIADRIVYLPIQKLMQRLAVTAKALETTEAAACSRAERQADALS